MLFFGSCFFFFFFFKQQNIFFSIHDVIKGVRGISLSMTIFDAKRRGRVGIKGERGRGGGEAHCSFMVNR